MQNKTEKVTMTDLFEQRKVIEVSIERSRKAIENGGIVGPKMFETKIANLEIKKVNLNTQIEALCTHLKTELDDMKENIERTEKLIEQGGGIMGREVMKGRLEHLKELEVDIIKEIEDYVLNSTESNTSIQMKNM